MTTTNEPDRFDLLELHGADPTPPPAPPQSQPAETPSSLPLSPAAQRLAERMAAPPGNYPRTYSAQANQQPMPVQRPSSAVERNLYVAVPMGTTRVSDYATPAERSRAEDLFRQQRDLPTVQEQAVQMRMQRALDGFAAVPSLGQSMVAGARAEARGVLISWQGQGSLNRLAIMNALALAELPIHWAPPNLSTHAVLGRVLGALNSSGRVVRAIRKAKSQEKWRAKWKVGDVGDITADDDNFGQLALTVTLLEDGEGFVTTGDAALAQKIREEVQTALQEELFSSADVTEWLSRTIKHHFAGVDMGNVMYVPRGVVGTLGRRDDADSAEALCRALKNHAGWGRSWMLPAIPVATSEQLQEGLAASLEAELAELRATVMGQTGTKGLVRALDRVNAIRDRANLLAAHLGEAMLTEVRNGCTALHGALTAIMGDVSQRAALLELR